MNYRRKIVDLDFCQSRYSRSGYGSNWLTLECGHEVRQKSSIPVGTYVYCKDCKSRSVGSVGITGNKVETWDKEKQWPVVTTYGSNEAASNAYLKIIGD